MEFKIQLINRYTVIDDLGKYPSNFAMQMVLKLIKGKTFYSLKRHHFAFALWPLKRLLVKPSRGPQKAVFKIMIHTGYTF